MKLLINHYRSETRQNLSSGLRWRLRAKILTSCCCHCGALFLHLNRKWSSLPEESWQLSLFTLVWSANESILLAALFATTRGRGGGVSRGSCKLFNLTQTSTWHGSAVRLAYASSLTPLWNLWLALLRLRILGINLDITFWSWPSKPRPQMLHYLCWDWLVRVSA